MVPGIDSFREKFKDYTDYYTIIGGTACDILLSEADLPFRATKDIDMILIMEDNFPEFASVFWEYIKEGGYKCGWKNENNMHFYRFLNLARRAGITLPVSAGVMPIVKRSQIERTVALSSASLPSEFTRMISRYQDDPESLYAAGIDYAVQQLRDLIEGGADGVHLYAMNDAKVAAAVYEGIKDLL